jgi:hypothetical protein
MQFHAKFVSTSISGDYYQAVFEEDEASPDSDSPYLLIQRQFEVDDDGECYIETHNKDFAGHFRLRRFEISPKRIVIEIDRVNNRYIQVTFDLTTNEFANVLPVLKILSGQLES